MKNYKLLVSTLQAPRFKFTLLLRHGLSLLPRLSLFGLFSTKAIESNYGMEDLCHTISTEVGKYTPCDPTKLRTISKSMRLRTIN